MTGNHLFQTTDEYFDKIVKRRPDGYLSNPAEVLYDYMRFEVWKTHAPPPGYKTLEERRKREKWPSSMDSWPSPIATGLIRLYPPASVAAPLVSDARPLPRSHQANTGSSSVGGGAWGSISSATDGGVNSYYMVVALRPLAGTTLYDWVGSNGWILWCIQQIAEVDEESRMVGWVHRTTMSPEFTGHTTAQIEEGLRAMAARGDPSHAQAMRDYADYQARVNKRTSG
ncbi:MAG: hypothetical protein GY772_22845, partial [bacterium]|nr:hypothetical protein [bacterium]